LEQTTTTTYVLFERLLSYEKPPPKQAAQKEERIEIHLIGEESEESIKNLSKLVENVVFCRNLVGKSQKNRDL
jgi:hypothetical protein